MPSEPFSHTREDLYAAVWSQPMRDACKRFGVSDVGLAKACRRLNVPRPKQGYWVKVEMGEAPPQEALPAAGPGPARWKGTRWVEPAPDPASPTKSPVEPVRVAATLDDLHPALLASRKILRSWDRKAGDVHYQQPCVAVDVSPPLLDRALLIMDALFRALESRGLRVEITAPSKRSVNFGGGDTTPSRTGVHVDEAFVCFEVVEGVDVVEVPRPPPPKPKRRSSFEAPPPPLPPMREERPNGKLVLKLLDPSRGHRKTWSDGRYRRVEDCLDRVVETLVRMEEETRRQRLEWEQRQREREVERRREEEAARRRREEEERVQRLHATLTAWRDARDVRALVKEARKIVDLAGRRINPEAPMWQFLAWAAAWAEERDPFAARRKEIAAGDAGLV